MNGGIIIHGVIEVLKQGEMLLRTLDDTAYATRLPAAFNASVGGHYRHCLDHFQSVLDALDVAEVNYDHRKRDRRIEQERDYALRETQRLMLACEAIAEDWLDRPIDVRAEVSYVEEEAPAMRSTLGRELMYAIAHAIHHYALMAVMCGMMGVPLPAGFGIAPSTLKHQAREAQLAGAR